MLFLQIKKTNAEGGLQTKMAQETARAFIDALHKLEEERDLDTISSLFAEDSEVGNVVTEGKNAREFWQHYRDNFGEVHSEFRNEIITDGRAALEWTTAGTSSQGVEFEYEGVSILEIEGERITRFHAYFDPNYLGKQIVPEDNRAEAA